MPLNPRIIPFLLGILALSACSGDPPASFHLRLRATDVQLDAVNQIELLLRPRELDRRFPEQPEKSYEGGRITTRVTARGELAMTIAGTWVRERSAGVNPGAGALWAVDVPMWSTDVSLTQTELMDPEARAYVLRSGEQIALGQAFLPWPLPLGGQSQLVIGCIQPMFAAECMNMQGMRDAAAAGADAGP